MESLRVDYKSKENIVKDFDKDPRRKQELRMRPVADRIYKQILGSDIEISRVEKEDEAILDREYAIDVQLKLPCGMILLGQEKFLSYEYRDFGTVTVEFHQNQHTEEPGDWFKLAPQFYFVGYCTKDNEDFFPWILLNWPCVVLATHKNFLHWRQNRNRDGYARASFAWVKMNEFPASCIIAKSEDSKPPTGF